MDKDFFMQPLITAGAFVMSNASELLTVLVLVMQAYYIFIKTRREKKDGSKGEDTR